MAGGGTCPPGGTSFECSRSSTLNDTPPEDGDVFRPDDRDSRSVEDLVSFIAAAADVWSAGESSGEGGRLEVAFRLGLGGTGTRIDSCGLGEDAREEDLRALRRGLSSVAIVGVVAIGRCRGSWSRLDCGDCGNRGRGSGAWILLMLRQHVLNHHYHWLAFAHLGIDMNAR